MKFFPVILIYGLNTKIYASFVEIFRRILMNSDNNIVDEYPAGTIGLRKRIFAWMLEKSGPNIDKELKEYKKSLFSAIFKNIRILQPFYLAEYWEK